MIGLDIDDSELKGLEDAINKLLDRMRESYRQQARFVSDASHELRTPISVIQGYANMLDRWGKKDKKHVYEYRELNIVEINADMRLVKQAMMILIENSVKYTKEGECIILKVGYDDNGKAYFCVQDNGIGIDEQEISHIFERFFRADSVRTRSSGGTGLGLSIAKWIIDNHKGYFEVLSRKGIGTRISVYL